MYVLHALFEQLHDGGVHTVNLFAQLFYLIHARAFYHKASLFGKSRPSNAPTPPEGKNESTEPGKRG